MTCLIATNRVTESWGLAGHPGLLFNRRLSHPANDFALPQVPNACTFNLTTSGTFAIRVRFAVPNSVFNHGPHFGETEIWTSARFVDLATGQMESERILVRISDQVTFRGISLHERPSAWSSGSSSSPFFTLSDIAMNPHHRPVNAPQLTR